MRRGGGETPCNTAFLLISRRFSYTVSGRVCLSERRQVFSRRDEKKRTPTYSRHIKWRSLPLFFSRRELYNQIYFIFFGHILRLNPSATFLDSASWLSPFTCQYTHNAVSSRMNKQQSRSRTQLENSSPPRQTRGVSTEQVLTMTNKSISPSLFLSFSDAIRRGVDRVTTAP